MTAEHLRPSLENVHESHLSCELGSQLAKAQTPPCIVDAVRLGRLTALQKPTGSVRGIVVGDMVRRLVARTMAQRLSKLSKQPRLRFSVR